jgi:hypothetical protein
MRAASFCLLWASIAAAGATWHAGYAQHRAERAKADRLAADLAASLFRPEQQLEALRRFDSYRAGGPEDALYFSWTGTMPAVGAWLLCSSAWPALLCLARPVRAARWAVVGGVAGGALLAALFAAGSDVYLVAGAEQLGRLRLAWGGAAFGGWLGTLVGAAVGAASRAEPGAAADPAAVGFVGWLYSAVRRGC